MLRTESELKNDFISADDSFKNIMEWVNRCDTLVIGPGLGRDSNIQTVVQKVIRKCVEIQKAMVIDADGIWTVEQNIDILQGGTRVILTPNKNEYSRLYQKAFGTALIENKNPELDVKELAKRLGYVTIVRKGDIDIISDGKAVISCETAGSLRRCGGQGDVLCGLIGCFSVWSLRQPRDESEEISPLMLGAYAGCSLMRSCASQAFQKNKRGMVAHDLIEFIAPTFYNTFESEEVDW